MELSLQCFVCGLFSLIPGLGIPFAVAALYRGRQARREAGTVWNPGQNYLNWGRRVAFLGLLVSFGCTVLTCIVVTMSPELNLFGPGHSGGG
jgi:hypothetical protein